MKFAKLGNTDIEISKVCLGGMSFGKSGTMHDWTLDEYSTEDIVKHALNNEINFLIQQIVTLKEQVKNI